MVDFGNSFKSATAIRANTTLRNTVGQSDDRFDFLSFSLTRRSSVTATLSRLSQNADLALWNDRKKILHQSNRIGRRSEALNAILDPGQYFLKISGTGKNTRYQLGLNSSPLFDISTPYSVSASPDPSAAPAPSSVPLLPPPVPPTPPPSRTETPFQPSPSAPPAPLPKKAWTVMVYMAADTLETFAIEDFLEMASVGSTSNINVVVQLDRTARYAGTPYDDRSFGDWVDTRRGAIQWGDLPTAAWGTSVGEADMGNAQTLKDFVHWSMGNYQADRYALVMWGHGDGLTAAFDDLSQDGISAQELNTVLADLPQKVDLIGADNCLMGNIEFAYELRNHASVLVGSQENEPGTGWTYDTLLSDLAINPQMTTLDFGKAIVDRYQQYSDLLPYDESLTLSAIDLTTLGSVHQPGSPIAALNRFATTLLSQASAAELGMIDRYRDQYDGAGTWDGYCDILNLCTSLAGDYRLATSIRNAAAGVVTAFNTINGWYYSSTFDRTTGIETHRGLSIYFSDRHSPPRNDYGSNHLQFAKDTQWDNLLNSWLWW